MGGASSNTKHSEPDGPDLKGAETPAPEVSKDRESPNGTQEEIYGPVKKRGCTDLLFLIFFIGAWAGLFIIAKDALINGNPSRLLVGQDMAGQSCGVDLNKEAHPFLYYTLNLEGVQQSSILDETENATITDLASLKAINNLNDYYYSVCVAECLTLEEMDELLATEGRAYLPEAAGLGTYTALPEAMCPYAEKYCVPVPANTTSVLNRYCIPLLAGTDESSRVSAYVPDAALGSWNQWVGDIAVVWPLLPVAAVISLVAGALVLVFLRMCAGVVVWASLLTFLMLFAAGGSVAYYYADTSPVMSDTNRNALYYGSYAIWGIGGLALLTVLCMAKKIQEGIAVVKAAALFVSNTPSVLLVPVFFFFLNVAFTAGWVFMALYIMSSVDDTATSEGILSVWSESTNAVMAYHIFMLFWGGCFLVSLNQLIVAGSVAHWYFTPLDGDGDKIVRGAVGKATYRALRYHLGSVAFGSFILAVLKMIKWFLRYLAAHSQQATANPNQACATCLPCGVGRMFGSFAAPNTILVWVLGCLSYLVHCFERCIRFLNRNAYIQIAIKGENFCKSAWAAFSLILRNPGRWVIAAGIGKTLRLLGLFSIIAISTLSCFMLTEKMYSDQISSPVFPGIMYAVVAFIIGSIVMDILSMAIDTTLQCYLTDEELHKESKGAAQFTPPPLQLFLSNNKSIGCCG